MLKIPQIPQEMIRLATHTRLYRWMLVFLFVWFAGSFFVYRPLSIHLRHLNHEAMEMREKLTKVETVAQGTSDFRMVIQALNDEYHNLKSKVLKPGEQAKVIASLSTISEDLSIDIVNIRPIPTPEDQKIEEGSGVVPRLFEVEIRCRFKTLGVFIEQLADLPLIMTLEEVDIQSETASSPMLTIRMILAAYEERI